MKSSRQFFSTLLVVIAISSIQLCMAQSDFADLRDSVRLQVSDLDCRAYEDNWEIPCEVIWRDVTTLTTGKDHMHEWVVLRVEADALVSRDWQLVAHYKSTDPIDGIDVTLSFGAATSVEERTEQLLNAASAFVTGWNLEAEIVTKKLAELRAENRYLIGYYPTMGVQATFTLKLEESQRELGQITVYYPGS